MPQRTDFINENRMLQKTHKVQRTNAITKNLYQ